MELLISDFISRIESEFDDVVPGSVKPETKFRDHFDWTSVNALVLFSMINVEYGVTLTAEDLQKSTTIQDLFNIISLKIANG
ncbi:MAG TPA: phosphopantetheine-binding protein [Bacteroidales bacterium]|nr:phosphopantetheine-binding protein [Bacteroidales bacterium]